MAVRRMLPFILVNVVVSAAVILAILYWWDSRKPVETSEVHTIALEASPISTLAPTSVIEVQKETREEAEEDGPTLYTVQRGDTLGSISNQFGVPMIDIMDANGIDDPNFLQVNQELVIPSGDPGEPVTISTPTLEASTLPTPIATLPLAEGEAVIEISDLIEPGNISGEAVIIVNNGQRPIALVGWQLNNNKGKSYTFGQVTLFGEGASLTIHSGSGQDGPSDLYWNNDEAVWQSSDTAKLVDSEGTVRANLEVGNP